jgi:hypothetical protein
MVTAIVASAGGAAAIGTLIVVLIVIGLYFLPTIVAYSRKVPNMGSVLVINLFLGWTFIGWVVAMAMAARSRWPNTAGGFPSRPTDPAAPIPTEHESTTDAKQTECPNGHPVPTGASFCPSCGSPVASRLPETTLTGGQPSHQRPLPGWARQVEHQADTDDAGGAGGTNGPPRPD